MLRDKRKRILATQVDSVARPNYLCTTLTDLGVGGTVVRGVFREQGGENA